MRKVRPEELNNRFTERFRELVGDATCRDIAPKLKVSRSTVNAYLNGARFPKLTVVDSIANYYGVDPQWLLGYDVPKYKEAPKPLRLEDLNPDQLALAQAIADLTPAEVQSVRAIVEQVKNLRGK